MASANRFFEALRPWAWTTPVLATLFGGCLVYAYIGLPEHTPAQGTVAAPPPAWPEPERPESINWTVFARRRDKITVKAGTLAKRFRLVGTFTVHGVGPVSPKRKAVLDDSKAQRQRIVSEGEAIDDVAVVNVLADRVVLRDGTGEETLWLSFSKSSDNPAAGGTGPREGTASELASETWNDFGGRRVGEFQWVFKREAFANYYQELRDNPDRLVQVFDSMEPVRDTQRRIEAYRLNVKGEAGFFDAVGMQQGDVVRRVNQMEMTSRQRAEYFISEFAKDRANAFVIDIEREGKPQKLIYQVR